MDSQGFEPTTMDQPASQPVESGGSEASETRHAPWWRRCWIPAGVLTLAVVVIGWLWLGTPDDFERGVQIVGTMMAVLLALVLCGIWLVLLSTARWSTVGWAAAGIALLAGVAVGMVRRVEFTGDMRPILEFRWEPTRLEKIAAHRRAQAANRASSKPAEADDDSQQAPAITPEDFPEFRGHHRDGVVTGPPLRSDWTTHPPTELWRQPCGGGYASFAIVGDFAVTIEQRGEDEAVVCYDIDDGTERWSHVYPALFAEAMGGNGPRATPTISSGRVYSLGATGELRCLNLLTGDLQWSVHILTSNNLQNAEWGMAGSPLVYEGKVIVVPGGAEGNMLAAYDEQTGELVWKGDGVRPTEGDNHSGYTSPMLMELDGQTQIVILTGLALSGHDPADGKSLWSVPFPTQLAINCAQPLAVPGDRIFITASYRVGGAMVQVNRSEDGTGWQVEKKWESRSLRSKFSCPIQHDGAIYGLDEGILVCIDPADGKRHWKRGRFGHGQLLLADNRILILAEDGDLALIEPTTDAYRELGRMKVLPGVKTWNPPALSRGRLLIRNHHEMACYDLRADE